MRNKLLSLAVASCFMAAETDKASTGNTRDAKDDPKQSTPPTPEQKAALEAEMDRVKGIELRGREEAKAMIRKDADHALSQVELWKKVAQYPTEAEAVAFVKGFRAECEEEAESGGELADSAGRIARNVSIMKRIVRAVFGWKQKQEDKTSIRVFHDDPYSDDVEENRALTLKILNGPGTWATKAGMLPKLDTGRPENADTGGGEESDPYRRTISAAEHVNPSKGDASVLANVMRVPVKLDGEDVSEDERNAKALDGFFAAFKALPEDKLPQAIEALIGKCNISSVKHVQEFGFKARDLYNGIVGAQGKPAGVQVRRTAGAEVGDDE